MLHSHQTPGQQETTEIAGTEPREDDPFAAFDFARSREIRRLQDRLRFLEGFTLPEITSTKLEQNCFWGFLIPWVFCMFPPFAPIAMLTIVVSLIGLIITGLCLQVEKRCLALRNQIFRLEREH